MKKICFFLVMTLMAIQYSFSQNSVNQYKYVIVPNTYEFLKEPDQYQLNSLSIFLFEKYGFTVLKENEPYPTDLYNNVCLALKSDVVNGSGLFTTKLKVVLKNCQNEIVFEGAEGKSKEKQYKVAYTEAIRKAFESVEELNYSYEPSSSLPQAKAIASQPKEVVVAVPATAEVTSVEVAKVPETQSDLTKDVASAEILYAQKISGGYQLVDSTPKVVMVLLETPKSDMFLVKGKDAMVYKENDQWILSDKSSGESKATPLNIKF